MNKLLRLLLALLLVTVLVLGVVSCGEEDTPAADDSEQTETNNEPKHTHTWVDADCDTPKTCKTCKETEGKALGHDWKAATTEAPKTCKRCGATEGDPLTPDDPTPPEEHTHSYEGVDYSKDATGHWKECACGEADGKTAVEPHTFGDWEETTPPQVGVPGVKTRSCACGYAETDEIPALPDEPVGEPTWEEYDVNLNTQGIKILGERNATKASDGRIWLDWAGSGIEMNVHLDTTYSIRVFLQAMAEEGTCTFAVYVDGELFGEQYYTIACGVEESYIEIANVPSGDHIIRIVKVTDYTTTSAEILGVWMDGQFLETPADNDLFIEFIGDAITTGYDDVTKSYAWIVAEAFDADYAITALNGYGLVNGTAEVGTGSMAQDYLKLNPLRDDMTPFRYDDREADVVVVNLGAEDYCFDNDYNSGAHDAEAFQAAYEKLLADIRYYNADAKILCVYGVANDGYKDAILAAVAAAGGEDAGIWTLELAPTAEVAEDGINLPSAEEQAAYAEVIGAKIAEIKDATFGEAGEPNVGEGESQDWNNA